MTRVAVAGVLGRMGRLAAQSIRSAPDLQYAGGFARARAADQDVYESLDRLFEEQRPDVVVDFTLRPATQQVARAAVEHGIAPVIGSSEWNDGECAQLRVLCEREGVGAMLVPNFALGAVLMMRFAQEAARFFPSAEIVELHRFEKRDKPSGTAAATAARIRENGGPSDVPVHSVRMHGLLAHQEVLFGNAGELLTIRHDAFSLESFAAGIVYAVRRVRDVRGLQIGLDVTEPSTP